MSYPQEKRVLKVIQFVAKEGRLDRRRFREIGRLLVKGMDKNQVRVPAQVFSDFLPPQAIQAAFDYYKAKMARRQDGSYHPRMTRPSQPPKPHKMSKVDRCETQGAFGQP